MGDDQKNETTTAVAPNSCLDDSDDNQLKIVEEEASSSSRPNNDPDTSAEDSKPLVTPNNNNNELASPSTSSNKAGFSGGKGGSKTVQPNFDFDYDGPPVVVSNGMALELVNRFGLNNAWGAFLKLKGYHTSFDKNAPQPPEHTQALKRFRRKIRTVREMFNALRDKNDDTNPLMSKEFVILLKSTGENGDGSNNEQPTPVETPPVGEKKKYRGKGKRSEETATPSVTEPISVQIDPISDANTSNGAAIPADPTHPKRPRKSTKKEIKRESVIAASNQINLPDQRLNPTNAAAINQSKIDEIVTNVIDRVMANSSQPNKDLPTVSTASNHKPLDSNEHQLPPTSSLQMQPALLGLGNVEQLQELYRMNPAMFNTFNPQSTTSLHNMQNLLSTVKTSTSLNPSVTTPLTLNTNTNAAKFLFQQAHPQQTPHAFLDSTTAQLFFPPPSTPQHTPGMGNFGVPFFNPNAAAAIRAAIQQQQQQQQHLPMFPGVQLPPQQLQGHPQWSIGQFDTNFQNQQLSNAPSTSKQTPPVAQSTPDKNLTVEVVPEEKIDVTVSPKVKSSKTNNSELLSTDVKPRKQSRSSTLSAGQSSSSKQPSPKVVKEKKKAVKTEENSTIPKNKELEETVIDLREQVEQLESQLNAERTKFTVHKRRMDQMRDKLKKKEDELQTARIDYACQKSDNGTLRQQIEILKTENEELHKRLNDSSVPEAPSTSKQSAPITAAKPTSSRTIATRRQKAPKKEPTPPESNEDDKNKDQKSPEKPSRKRRKTAIPAKEESVEPADDNEQRRKSKRLSSGRPKALNSTYN